jgi:FkbM family methyltransferase
VPAFEEDLINVLYDADPECVEQIRQRTSALKSKTHVFPVCFGGTTGTVEFHINLDPYTSSILPTNPDYRDFYAQENGLDYVWGDSSRTVETREFGTHTIDAAFGQKLIDCPPPDFLSVDTQGSEFAILSGARQALESSILGVLAEVEFHPMYANQKLFGDLSNLLSEHEFYFVKFTRLLEFSPHRAPLGLRGDGFQVVGEALFLKRSLARSVAAALPSERALKLSKLAFIAVAFGQIEYALALLDRREWPGPLEIPEDWKARRYIQFLDRFHALSKSAPQVFRPTFGERYSFAASKARFQPVVPNEPAPDHTPAAPAAAPLVKAVRSIRSALGRRLPRVKAAYRAFKSVKPVPIEADNEIEALLKSYGLSEQAAILRTRRKE